MKDLRKLNALLEKAVGKLSETTREHIGRVGSEKREDMPSHVFLKPAERKYPVKEKRDGDWQYTNNLLLAAARRARLNGEEALATRADKIREEEFGEDAQKGDGEYVPTKEMRSAAARGLELRRKFGRGGTNVGVARARDLSSGRNLSASTVKRMHSYFARHAVDKKGKDWANQSNPSAGYIAWLLWGGDSGASWSKRHAEAMNKAIPKRRKGESKFQQHIRGEMAAYKKHPEQFPGGRKQAIAIAAQQSGAARKAEWHDQMPGGAADNKKPTDFDLNALINGIREEFEHTESPSIATEIAMDHLTDDPHYYDDTEE